MKHTEYVIKCSEVIKSLVFREGNLRDSFINAAETCFANFPLDEVPYGDGCKCEEIMEAITNHGQKSISNVISEMDDNQVTELVNKIFQLNIDLIMDEAMEKVDNLWKTTYLRSMKFHN